MAGLCGFDGDVGGLQIADLANHDDVRILAQEGAQRYREAQPGAFVDVDLVDAGQVDFHRIFYGGDIGVRLVQDVEAGIQGNRLAGTGRPGHQDHAVGAAYRVQQQVFLRGIVAWRVDPELRLAGVEDAHDDFFAE